MPCCPSSSAALCSVPHQRHEHARRGGCGREHEGYCKSAHIRPVAAPVGVLRRTRNAVMHSMRDGIEPGRQGHRMPFSRCATPTIRAALCVNQLSDLTGPDSVPAVILKGLRAPDEFGNGESTAPDCSAHDADWRMSRGQCLAIQACGTIRSSDLVSRGQLPFWRQSRALLIAGQLTHELRPTPMKAPVRRCGHQSRTPRPS